MLAKDIALWAAIRADYLSTGMSYKKLAEKHGVSLSTLKKRAAAEHWTRAREAVENGLDGTEPVDGTGTAIAVPEITAGIETKRDRLATFMQASDAMMDRILDALTSPEVISPYSLKLLASALRDLREMQGLNKSALDIEEQQARIDKLRSETRIVETPDSQGIVVEFVDTYGAEE
jgi:hypothetical protein